VVVSCIGCGNDFWTQRCQKRKFCTRECCFAYETAKTLRLKQEARDARVAARLRPCAVCAAISADKTCGVECSKALARIQAREHSKAAHVLKLRSCAECQASFAPEYGSKRRSYCSEVCARRRASRVGKSTRRARWKGTLYEFVDPIQVFERDGWRCHICHKPTPKRLRGSRAKRAPELDHILPLAAGGTHTSDNLACSCRSCNCAKGATPLGQMRLTLSVGG
jgi:hypothetical protein